MPVLFAATIFVSATLLFWVEPMIAKMVLPRLGGTPAVWNTCLVFFQTILLAGYAYAHALASRAKFRRLAWLHCLVMFLPFMVLPLGLSDRPPPAGNPIGWLFLLLAISVGLPFFALSTTAPLLQKWFSFSESGSSRDPYYLYAASNVGSLLALLGYPLLIEPFLPLRGADAWSSQVNLWTVGYGIYCVLVLVCLIVTIRISAKSTSVQIGNQPKNDRARPLTLNERLRWILLAFVPSSLLLGVTAFITQDIAAIPLLWVIPLSLYLLSFILSFGRWPEGCHRIVLAATPCLILLALFLAESGLEPGNLSFAFGLGLPGIITLIGLHLLTFFALSLMCHGELAATRPPAARLTEFYLLIATGGVLGGLFNALVAPVIFSTIFEHELVLVFAVLLLRGPAVLAPLSIERWMGWTPNRARQRTIDVLVAGLLGVVTLDLLVFYASEGTANSPPLPGLYTLLNRGLMHAAEVMHVSVESLWKVGLFGVPFLLCLFFRKRPVRLCFALVAIVLACHINGPLQEKGKDSTAVIYRNRSFFSVLRVEVESQGTPAESHVLMHGSTLHGQQFLHPSLTEEPLTYYTRSGPVGQIMRLVDEANPTKKFALIGLGTGACASYGRKGDELTCYEIDNAVVKIAKNTTFFTYLSDCAARGCKIETIVGDARLKLADGSDHTFNLIIVDAFSSDAIPVHLLTRQAFELYRQKLVPEGILLIHLSNRYLELDPVIGNIAHELGLNAFSQHDDVIDLPGKWQSDWAAVTTRNSLGSPWTPIETNAKVGVWTDDYSNLLRVFHPH